MFEGMPNFLRVTQLRPRPFSGELLADSVGIAQLKTYIKCEVSGFMYFEDMFKVHQIF